MAFDVKNPENKPIVDYVKECKCLIIDPASSSRNTLRKLVGAMGAKNANIDVAENFEEGSKKIADFKPEIVFCEFSLGAHSGTELVELAKSVARDPLELTFIVISEKNSPMVTSTVAEKDADALIVKPFTYAMCEEELVAVLIQKLSLTEYDRMVDEGRQLAEKEQFDAAIEKLQSALSKSEEPTLACFWLGKSLRKQGRMDEALSYFQKGLEKVPDHYKCLFGLFDLFNEMQEFAQAYEIATKITSSYPIPITRIPEFVHLSIRNRKFEDIVGFYELFSNIEGVDDITSQYVAAGFVVYAKYLARKGELDQAADALKKATNTCKGKVGIQKEIAITYMMAGRLKESELLLGELPPEIRNAPEILVALMEYYIKAEDQGQIVQMGADLMKKGLGTPKIYREVISQSVAIRRPVSALKGLVELAAQKFPASLAEFQELIQGAIEADEAEKLAEAEGHGLGSDSDDDDDDEE